MPQEMQDAAPLCSAHQLHGGGASIAAKLGRTPNQVIRIERLLRLKWPLNSQSASRSGSSRDKGRRSVWLSM